MSIQIKGMECERDMLIASNKSLAEYNLSREPAYRSARQELIESHKAASELRKEVERKRDQLNEISRQTSLDTTLALLQTAAAEAEEDSDKIASQLLSGEISVDSFLSQFLAKRKTSHLRRIKTEKLMEHIRDQQRSGFISSAIDGSAGSAGPIRPAPLPPTGSIPPYPMSGVQMPMPQPSVPGSFPFSRPTGYGPR